MNRWLLLFHLIGAAVWLGGMITIGAVVPTMRRTGIERSQIQAVARSFGRLSWVALALTVATGVIAVLAEPALASSLPWFAPKLGLVGAAAGLALWHQLAARSQTPMTRGLIQAGVLVTTIGIYAIAAGW